MLNQSDPIWHQPLPFSENGSSLLCLLQTDFIWCGSSQMLPHCHSEKKSVWERDKDTTHMKLYLFYVIKRIEWFVYILSCNSIHHYSLKCHCCEFFFFQQPNHSQIILRSYSSLILFICTFVILLLICQISQTPLYAYALCLPVLFWQVTQTIYYVKILLNGRINLDRLLWQYSGQQYAR